MSYEIIQLKIKWFVCSCLRRDFPLWIQSHTLHRQPTTHEPLLFFFLFEISLLDQRSEQGFEPWRIWVMVPASPHYTTTSKHKNCFLFNHISWFFIMTVIVCYKTDCFSLWHLWDAIYGSVENRRKNKIFDILKFFVKFPLNFHQKKLF